MKAFMYSLLRGVDMKFHRTAAGLLGLFISIYLGTGILVAQKRLVVIDQDGVGPGGSDIQSILLLLEAQDVKVLGVTVVSGDVWADEGTRHILRALETVGRSDVPVFTGSNLPLIRTAVETRIEKGLYGKAWYQGALGIADEHAPLKEGEPTTTAAGSNGVEFLISMVHKYPHQVTIFAGGPMTNIAVAIRTDPDFAKLAKELVFMGGSLNPKTDDPEFAFNPRHEFNFWFDPEAAHIVLTAPWPGITQTTVDVSLQARLTHAAGDKLKTCGTRSAKYMSQYGSGSPYMWDELAALTWIDPAVVAGSKTLYVDVALDHGYNYGDTLTWSPANHPDALPLQPVRVQMELDHQRFERRYLALMCGTAF
jgi:inosine-uridine nucleoside N-ribohydrolase